MSHKFSTTAPDGSVIGTYSTQKNARKDARVLSVAGPVFVNSRREKGGNVTHTEILRYEDGKLTHVRGIPHKPKAASDTERVKPISTRHELMLKRDANRRERAERKARESKTERTDAQAALISRVQ